MVRGIDKLRMIALWNGKSEDTDKDSFLAGYMVDQARELGGIVELINPSKLIPE